MELARDWLVVVLFTISPANLSAMTLQNLDALTPHSRRLTGPRRFGTVHPGKVLQNSAPSWLTSASADPLAAAALAPSLLTRRALIVFPDVATAGQSVAGVPAAARAVRDAALAGFTDISVVLPQQWWPDRWVRSEVARLGSGVAVKYQTWARATANAAPCAQVINGTALAPVNPLATAGNNASAEAGLAGDAAVLLRQRSRELLRATAKPGDGIVSRHLNRPISQAITGQLLNFRGITPLHATFGTAALAVLMFLALVLGGAPGLMAGALLFQAASVVDGVDGEIARATFQSSPAGARLDSLIDAGTNLAFIAGTSFNLFRQGDSQSALLGAVGLALFAIGLTIIARRSRNRPTGLTFDAVKEQLGQHRSPLRTFFIWLTMRDFFALAFAVLIAAGYAGFALHAFAVIVLGWFVVVVVLMRRNV